MKSVNTNSLRLSEIGSKLIIYSHAPSLSQIKGAEESQFILRRDVWFEQQRSAAALQDLGGEKPQDATHVEIEKMLSDSHYTCYFVIAENTQQDQKNLLCL